jgi:hypothetical protein
MATHGGDAALLPGAGGAAVAGGPAGAVTVAAVVPDEAVVPGVLLLPHAEATRASRTTETAARQVRARIGPATLAGPSNR